MMNLIGRPRQSHIGDVREGKVAPRAGLEPATKRLTVAPHECVRFPRKTAEIIIQDVGVRHVERHSQRLWVPGIASDAYCAATLASDSRHMSESTAQISADKVADLRIKHLEMIQAAVTRMAGFSASLKNHCLTVVTALAGFAVAMKAPTILWIGPIPLLVFALLDAQYLRLERRFRDQFQLIRTRAPGAVPDFDLGLTAPASRSYWSALFSWSILAFYLPLAVSIIAITQFLPSPISVPK